MKIKRAARTCAAFALLIPAFYFLAAGLGALLPNSHATPDAPTRVEIRLIAGPIHYDFLLPLTPKTKETFAFAEDYGLELQNPNAQWLVTGWGARGFYTQTGHYSDLRLSTVLRAIVGDQSVLRLDLAGHIDETVAYRSLFLSPAQYDALLEAIVTTADIRSPLIGVHLSEHDLFFASPRGFNILRTCNTWIGRTLAEAGVPFGRWTPTPYAVTFSHWFFHGN